MKKGFRIFVIATLLTVVLLLTAGCPMEADDTLPAPTNLTAEALSASSIRLTWNPVNGVNYYVVYRTTDSTWANSIIIASSIDTTTYNDSGLIPDTTYYYKVAAREGLFSSYPIGNQSESVSATTTGSAGILPAPTGLTAVSTSTSQINLSWTPVEGASVYNIYRTTDSTWEDYSLLSAAVSTTVYSDYGLSANTTYYYKVGARRSNVTTDPVGELSPSVSATTLSSNTVSVDLDAPENLTATANGRIITLEWDAVEGASSYQILGSFTSDGTFVSIGSTGSIITVVNIATMASYGNVPLEPNTEYYFKVRAYSGSSYSELSEVVSATTGS